MIGNTGSNSTGEALHATEQGFAVGMHAALQINPYYGKTSKLGLIAHFDAGRAAHAWPCHAAQPAAPPGAQRPSLLQQEDIVRLWLTTHYPTL